MTQTQTSKILDMMMQVPVICDVAGTSTTFTTADNNGIVRDIREVPLAVGSVTPQQATMPWALLSNLPAANLALKQFFQSVQSVNHPGW